MSPQICPRCKQTRWDPCVDSKCEIIVEEAAGIITELRADVDQLLHENSMLREDLRN